MSKEELKKQGKLIVFSAPSGSGKTTIVRHLLKQPELNLEFSISATSREARGNEVHGKDYYYLSLKEFKPQVFIRCQCESLLIAYINLSLCFFFEPIIFIPAVSATYICIYYLKMDETATAILF